MKSLYDDLKENGVELDNHESDLYFHVTGVSTMILAWHTEVKTHSMFKHAVNGNMYYEVPFAFQPFWDKVAKRSASK